MRAAGGPALGQLARRASGGGAGQHRVLGRYPALASSTQKRRRGIFHRGRAQHARVARLINTDPSAVTR